MTDEVVGRKKLTGSFAAKVLAFFLLAAGAFAASFAGIAALCLYTEGFYTKDFGWLLKDACYDEIISTVYEIREYLENEKPDAAREVCEGTNLDVAVFEEDEFSGESGDIFWATYGAVYEAPNYITDEVHLNFSEEKLKQNPVIKGHALHADKTYVFRVYINMDFPEADGVKGIYESLFRWYGVRHELLWIMGIGMFVCGVSFLFLMCSAGRRNGEEGVQPSVFYSIPLDVHTAAFGIVALGMMVLILLIIDNIGDVVRLGIVCVVFSALTVWLTFYFRELGTRMKLGGWWRNTVIYRLLGLCGRVVRFSRRGVAAVFRGFPMMLNTMIVFFAICFLEFLGVCCYVRRGGQPLWALEKVVLFFLVAYIALMCRRILKGSQALAEGRQNEIVDTKYMLGDFKVCGENLNSIGQGISKAVAERMKSEHLKTELITNVSHDLKTPLTSIINYANLIAEEKTENEKITEYSEVLVRQSGRLKKLLEDLVEASKATTGNLEVNLKPCEVSVILSQALGEYQQKMEEKQLELIVTQPEEPVKIMADGRHMWRIFDNLLNNICKYAREDSRVYLSVEQKEESVSIIFRNMSKYALNISAEELQERFVRGDKSRHMEGSGLGLSVAKSLAELQNGRMEVVTDGDLFKVTLSFGKL